MQNSKSLAIFYWFTGLVLALAGLALLLVGPLWLHLFYPADRITEPALALARMAGAGLVLAAAINLLCLSASVPRKRLHGLVSAFLVLLAAGHTLTLMADWWLWALPLVHLLPLVPVPASRAGERTGKVKWFNPRKGFGFITAEDDSEFFVHFRALRNGGRQSLRPGTRVRFLVRETERGDQARDVYIVDDNKQG